MVVSWTPPSKLAETLPDKKTLALILCPASAAGPHARDYQGNPVQAEPGQNGGDSASYLCALVMVKTGSETYEMNLWRQVVVQVAQMTSEVILKYDTVARNWLNHDSDAD
jgi:kinesin family protein 2/24